MVATANSIVVGSRDLMHAHETLKGIHTSPLEESTPSRVGRQGLPCPVSAR